MRRRSALVGFVIGCGVVTRAGDTRADDEQKTLPCRPTTACTADLVAPGDLEIEAGYVGRRLGGAGRQAAFPLLLKLTLAPWVQVQVGTNGLTRTTGDTPARYFDNATFTLKLHLLDQTTTLPALALSATVSVPTLRDQRGYVPLWDATGVAYASKDFGPIHADLNLGLTAWRIDGEALAQPWSALALSATLVAPFGVLAELYAFGDASPIASRDGGILFGITHSVRPWLVFDAGADIGLFPTNRAFSVFVGMGIVPARLWRR